MSRKRTAMCEILSFLVLVLFDQWTKALAVSALKGKPAIEMIRGVLELYYLENTGAAFSMLENAQWVFLLIAVAAIGVIAWLLVKIPTTRHMQGLRWCLVFIAAGAAGNLIDRLFLHYVRDFIYFSIINFPVFNVADIYVTVSTVVLIVLMLFFYKEEDYDFLKRKKEER